MKLFTEWLGYEWLGYIQIFKGKRNKEWYESYMEYELNHHRFMRVKLLFYNQQKVHIQYAAGII